MLAFRCLLNGLSSFLVLPTPSTLPRTMSRLLSSSNSQNASEDQLLLLMRLAAAALRVQSRVACKLCPTSLSQPVVNMVIPKPSEETIPTPTGQQQALMAFPTCRARPHPLLSRNRCPTALPPLLLLLLFLTLHTREPVLSPHLTVLSLLRPHGVPRHLQLQLVA